MLEKTEKLRQGNSDFVSKIKAEDLMMAMFSTKLKAAVKLQNCNPKRDSVSFHGF